VNISVFGLGYVGTVSAGCLAKDGHRVLSVDPATTKVELINRGQSPIIEPEIGEIVTSAVQDGRLRATDDVVRAVLETTCHTSAWERQAGRMGTSIWDTYGGCARKSGGCCATRRDGTWW
jgi:nucleoside-diphosphate-sugar epimerase